MNKRIKKKRDRLNWWRNVYLYYMDALPIKLQNQYRAFYATKQTPDIVRKLMRKHFVHRDGGFIVYKTFGLYYPPNPEWVIMPDSTIHEEFDMDPKSHKGICFSSLKEANERAQTVSPIYKCSVNDIGVPLIWECFIADEWLGTAAITSADCMHGRCATLKLLRIVPYKFDPNKALSRIPFEERNNYMQRLTVNWAAGIR